MKILIPNARLSFPELFKAKAFSPDQDPRFSATFILTKGSPGHVLLRDTIKAAAAEKWPKGPPKGIKVAMRDGSEKDHMDGFDEECVFFNASSDKRPGVFDRDRSPLLPEDGKPYAGCQVNASVEIWCQDNQYGKRVNASLLGVQFAADGDAFGGGGRAAEADDFPALDDDPAPPPATAGNGADEDTSSWLD